MKELKDLYLYSFNLPSLDVLSKNIRYKVETFDIIETKNNFKVINYKQGKNKLIKKDLIGTIINDKKGYKLYTTDSNPKNSLKIIRKFLCDQMYGKISEIESLKSHVKEQFYIYADNNVAAIEE